MPVGPPGACFPAPRGLKWAMALARARRGLLTFVVGGEPFEVPKPFLALHSPLWAQRLSEDPELAARPIELQGEARAVVLGRLGGAGGLWAQMSRPYLVVSHRQLCRSCQREVEDEELVVNSDGLEVHVECGTVMEMEGVEIHGEGLAGATQGHDLTNLKSRLSRLHEPASF